MIHRRVFALSLTTAAAAAAPAWGQTVSPDVNPSSAAVGGAAEAPLGELFTSRVEGIEFRPPDGGTKLRQINTGEIVRYAYPDKGWTLRLKSAPNSTKLPLTAPAGSNPQGLLELTAGLLTDRGGQPATVLSKDVVMVGPRNVGLIQARDSAGIDRLFVQLAVIPDGKAHYFVLQMVSPAATDPKAAAGSGREADAQLAFRRTLATMALLDRGAFFREQKQRFYHTQNLWVQLGGDHKRVDAALQPAVRFLRVVRDGKDVGYVQVNVRPESHHGRDGYLVVERSHVEQLVQPPAATATAAPAGASAGAAATDAANAGTVVDLMPQAAPGAAGAAVARTVQVDRDARFFVTFDRSHEDWSMVTRVDNVPGQDDLELGNSDVEVRRAIDQGATDRVAQEGVTIKQPIVVHRERQVLRVDDFKGKLRTGQPFEDQLDPRYLPQAMAQLLPQLLPADAPQTYMFAYFVSDQRHLLLRYVDVAEERDVVLDGQKVRAVPISDRIGADGSDTVHYVDRKDNTYFGSVSEDGHLVVLPTDEDGLARVWHGFKELPEPPPPAEDATPRRPAGGGHASPGLDPQSFRGR